MWNVSHKERNHGGGILVKHDRYKTDMSIFCKQWLFSWLLHRENNHSDYSIIKTISSWSPNVMWMYLCIFDHSPCITNPLVATSGVFSGIWSNSLSSVWGLMQGKRFNKLLILFIFLFFFFFSSPSSSVLSGVGGDDGPFECATPFGALGVSCVGDSTFCFGRLLVA